MTSASDNNSLLSDIEITSETQKVSFIGSTSYKIGKKFDKN